MVGRSRFVGRSGGLTPPGYVLTPTSWASGTDSHLHLSPVRNATEMRPNGLTYLRTGRADRADSDPASGRKA